jgi:hypothetical protein
MRVFIGLDVSLAKTAICVVDRDGAVQWQGKVPSEPGPLIKRLAEWTDNGDARLPKPPMEPLRQRTRLDPAKLNHAGPKIWRHGYRS